MNLSNRSQHRLFFAFDFSEDFQQQLDSWCATQPINGRRIPRYNYHLTLFFVGAVQNHRVADLIDAVTLPEVRPFTLSCNKTGYFPRQELLFCEIEQGQEQVQIVAKHLQRTLQSHFGKREKKRYLPHISIARDARPPVDFLVSPPLTTTISQFCLMESLTLKSGVYYETVMSWPLYTPSDKEILLGAQKKES